MEVVRAETEVSDLDRTLRLGPSESPDQPVRGNADVGFVVALCAAGLLTWFWTRRQQDGTTVITSDQSTNSDADKLPERVAVIGGGVIGAEFASVYTDMGVKTTLLEALPNPILPLGPDRDVANVLARSLTSSPKPS